MNAIDLYQHGRNVRNLLFSRAVAGSFMAFGAKSIIEMPVLVHGARRVSIGREVLIGSDSWLYTSGSQALLEIGDGTRMSGHCVLSAVRHVRVGRSVLLGRNVYIADHNHGAAASDTPILAQELDAIGPVIVEDNAWLGQNCVILPGVTIGRGSVVGANSVVRDDVPPRTVAVGAPARIARHLDETRPRNVDERAAGISWGHDAR
jgi:acetyltransferase-like isoleucine patch superfamily enzyme